MNSQKKFTQHLTILTIFILLTTSCESNKTELSFDYKINLNTQLVHDNLQLSDIIQPGYRFVPLESNDEILIGNISKVICFNKYIYILDAYAGGVLAKFTEDGHFVSKIGSKGDGPGEYLFPLDFTIDKQNGHIYVVDQGVTLIEYDQNGKYLNKRKFADYEFSGIQVDKNIDGFTFISGDKDDNLILTTNDLYRIKSYFPFKNKNINKLLVSPLQRMSDNTIVYRRFLNDTVFKIVDGHLYPHIILNYNNNFTEDLFSLNITKNKFNKILKNGNSCITKLYFESDVSVFTAFSSSDNLFLSFYSKESDSVNIFNYGNFINDITFEKRSSYVIGTNEDEFIFFVQGNNLIEGLNKNKEKYEKTDNFLKALKLSKTINQRSNPILLFVKINY